MADYADHVATLAGAFETPPVLLGHSLGGLVSVLAASRTTTSGVILLAPSAPWGVSGSTMEEAVSAVALYALGPFWAQAIEPDYSTFGRYAVDRLPRAKRRALYERMRPESGRAIFETLNWWLDPLMSTSVRPERIGAPILALSGERDAIHPPATVRETAKRLDATHETMSHMSHWLPGEPGCDLVAERCLAWLSEQDVRLAAE